MLDFFKFACSGFWTFVGVLILLNVIVGIVITGIVEMWSRYMRYLMVKKHGWPPEHLDADWDFEED